MIKRVEELWVILRGTTWGDPKFKVTAVPVGFDPDTGEDVYDYDYDTTWDPHEEFVKAFTDEDEAKQEYLKMVHEYEDSHRWPWNNGHFECDGSGDIKTEFTDNDDAEWFILRKYKIEHKKKEDAPV